VSTLDRPPAEQLTPAELRAIDGGVQLRAQRGEAEDANFTGNVRVDPLFRPTRQEL